jgi:hypothetical protein
MDWIETLKSLRTDLDRQDMKKERTLDFVLRLVDRVPGPFSEDEERAIVALARKIDLTGNIYAAYDEDWRKAVRKTSIKLEGWPLLIGVLLYQAERSTEKGKALKCLNNAFNALDAYRKQGGKDHAGLLAKKGEDLLDSIL